MPVLDRSHYRCASDNELVQTVSESLQPTELEVVLSERLADYMLQDENAASVARSPIRAQDRIDQLARDNKLLAQQVAALQTQLDI